MSTGIETKCIHEGWKPSQGEPRQLLVYQSIIRRNSYQSYSVYL